MNTITKIALGALMLAGTAALAAAPADARVAIGIGIGGPGYYGGYGGYDPGAYCDYYSRWYDPYRCRWDYGYYDEPIWWGNNWYYGHTRYRFYGGHLEYYVGGGWHHDVRFGHGGGGYAGYHGGGHRR
jgi:hypothetical protein